MLTMHVNIEMDENLGVKTTISEEQKPDESLEELERKLALTHECVFGVLFRKAIMEKNEELYKLTQEGKIADIYAEAEQYVNEVASEAE